MAIEVIVNMNNNNSMVALAYLKECENPLIVLCNYILYCLSISPEKKLRHDELIIMIEQEFGLKMPHSIVKVCIRLLRNEDKVKILDHGKGYLSKAFFDLDDFNNKRTLLKEREEGLINDLIKNAKEYDQEWSYNDARKYLTTFLIEKENAANLFLNCDIQTEGNRLSPSWHIGKYISQILDTNDINKDYLIDVVNGLMIYIGLNQTTDYSQEKNQKFKGTEFYVDTKLLLRALGFSWNLEVDGTKELFSLITNDYGGILYAFEHTIGEVENALYNAWDRKRTSEDIFDEELRVCSELNGYNSFDFELFYNSARDRIQTELGVKIKSSTEWSKENSQKYNLGWRDLYEYIQLRHPTWKKSTILNDVDSINYINIMRCGDYSIRYGGSKKRPVIITSNSVLVKDIKNYIIEHRELDRNVAEWNTHALPIITDNMIMCRLWMPKAKTREDIPILTLARNAYAAQRSDTKFLEKLRSTAKEVKQKHGYSYFDLSELRKDKLERILAKRTGGNTEEIDTNVIADSFEELLKMETFKLEDSINHLENINGQNIIFISKQKQQIIISSAKRFINKIGYRRILIYIAKFWWVVCAVLLGLMTFLFQSLDTTNMNTFILMLIPILIEVLDKAINKTKIKRKVMYKTISYVWNRYRLNIEISLEGIEKDYFKEIINYCFENTPIFNRHISCLSMDKINIDLNTTYIDA